MPIDTALAPLGLVSQGSFEWALHHHDLHHFLAGDAPYFVDAKTNLEEPKNVEQAFDLQIYPYIVRTHDTNLPDALADGLCEPTRKVALPIRDRLGGG